MTQFQTSLSMGFLRQEYGSGFPFLSPGDLSNRRIKPGSLTLQENSLPAEPPKYPKFIHLTIGSVAFVQHGFIFPSSQPLVTTIIPFCSRVRPFHLPHTSDIMKCSTFSDISLTIRPSSFIHVVANGRFSFFSWLNNILLYIHIYMYIYTHQFNSVSQSCPTLCDPMNHSTTGLPVHHHLLEFTQTHVH